jgi:hypothetical protein
MPPRINLQGSMSMANQKHHGYTNEEYVSYGSDVLATNSLNWDTTICQEKGMYS